MEKEREILKKKTVGKEMSAKETHLSAEEA